MVTVEYGKISREGLKSVPWVDI